MDYRYDSLHSYSCDLIDVTNLISQHLHLLLVGLILYMSIEPYSQILSNFLHSKIIVFML